jgi:hypothetical protein
MSNMTLCSGGDLTYFAVNCIYGELLAENSIINDLETGVLEFLCCLADGCAPQGKGHFFGSLNLGAEREMMGRSVNLAERMAGMLGKECPWRNGDEEWGFLDKVR